MDAFVDDNEEYRLAQEQYWRNQRQQQIQQMEKQKHTATSSSNIHATSSASSYLSPAPLARSSSPHSPQLSMATRSELPFHPESAQDKLLVTRAQANPFAVPQTSRSNTAVSKGEEHDTGGGRVSQVVRSGSRASVSERTGSDTREQRESKRGKEREGGKKQGEEEEEEEDEDRQDKERGGVDGGRTEEQRNPQHVGGQGGGGGDKRADAEVYGEGDDGYYSGEEEEDEEITIAFG